MLSQFYQDEKYAHCCISHILTFVFIAILFQWLCMSYKPVSAGGVTASSPSSLPDS